MAYEKKSTTAIRLNARRMIGSIQIVRRGLLSQNQSTLFDQGVLVENAYLYLQRSGLKYSHGMDSAVVIVVDHH